MKKTPEALERLIRRKRWQRRGRRLLRFSIRLMALIGVLALVIYIAIQNKTVQNWATQKAANYLSEELQTKVEIGSIDIDFFDKLILENFYLEDLNQDTLIFANRLSANFNTNLIALIRRKIDIVDLTLEDAEINLRRDSGQVANNLVLLVNKLFPANPNPNAKEKPKKPFFLDVEAIYLHRVKFERNDIPWGKYLLVDTEQGTVRLNQLDLADRYMDIKYVHFINPLIQVEERIRDEEAMNEEWNKILAEQARADSIATLSETEAVPDSLKKNFLLKIDAFRLDDGRFISHNFRKVAS